MSSICAGSAGRQVMLVWYWQFRTGWERPSRGEARYVPIREERAIRRPRLAQVGGPQGDDLVLEVRQ
jgi:hypothetical protein